MCRFIKVILFSIFALAFSLSASAQDNADWKKSKWGPGDEIGVVGDQEQDTPGDIRRVAQPAHRDAGDDLLFGGDGPDHIDGGPGSDTGTYAGTAGGVTVSLGDTGIGAGEDSTFQAA